MIDRTKPDELLRVTFDITFPSLSCEFLEIDVSDALGMKRFNLTKTVLRTPLDHKQQPTAHALPEASHKKMKAGATRSRRSTSGGAPHRSPPPAVGVRRLGPRRTTHRLLGAAVAGG